MLGSRVACKICNAYNIISVVPGHANATVAYNTATSFEVNQQMTASWKGDVAFLTSSLLT